jgi:hypothetical protein
VSKGLFYQKKSYLHMTFLYDLLLVFRLPDEEYCSFLRKL